MKIKIIKCKSALSNSGLPGLDYSLNPYLGCQHNCIYCYAPNVLKVDRCNWGKCIGVKSNIPVVLSKELKIKKIGTIGISTVTDPYQPIEKKYKMTRYCLEQLIKYDFPIHIQTKSSIINRDFDIISKISNVEIMISISTFNDYERKIFEPFSSSINERLNTLKFFSEIGIKTSVFLGPIIPTIKYEELIKNVNFFIEYNVDEIMIDNLHLKKGIWKNIYSKIKILNYYENKLSKNKFTDNKLITDIYKILIDYTKKYKIKIRKAF
jgi:DNA repair photolyase